MDDIVVALQAALGGLQSRLWTALPGIVNKYDAAKMTVSVQPAIKGRVLKKDGEWNNEVTLPLLEDCPVQFPGGKDTVFTFPIAEGDEGIIILSSRCIDAWWQSGGIQTQAEYRMHDLSDGMFIPGIFSQPRVIPNVNVDFPELRNRAGTLKFAMNATGFRVTGVLEIDGALKLGGAIQSLAGAAYAEPFATTGDIIANSGSPQQVTLTGHLHTSGGPGAPTSAPTPGT
jgi:hypothetical protein